MKRLDKDVEILINLASIKEPEEFLVDFRKYHQGYVSNVGETITDGERIQYFSFVYGFEEDLWTFKIVFWALSVIMALILLLFVINLISDTLSLHDALPICCACGNYRRGVGI